MGLKNMRVTLRIKHVNVKSIKVKCTIDRFMSTNDFPNIMQMGDGMSEC